MKTVFKISFFLFSIASFAGCLRSTEFDKSTGITTQMDFGVEIINSEAMKLNETWTNTKVIDFKAELKKRANINVDDVNLSSFKILGFSVELNETRCKQLSSITMGFTLPATPPISPSFTVSDNTLLALCGAKIFSINATTDPKNVILTSNYAPSITKGDKTTINYAMTAKEAFSTATGVTLRIVTEAKFKPK
jgi:hypothetical protein